MPTIPGSPFSSDMSALVTPDRAVTSDLAGTAAAAPAPAPASNYSFGGVPLPALDSKFEVAKSISDAPSGTWLFGGPQNNYAKLHDPTERPAVQFAAQAAQDENVTKAYGPLTNMGGPWERALSFFSKQDPNAHSPDVRADAAAIYSDPRVKALITSDPQWLNAAKAKPVEFAQVLKTMMSHADGAPDTVTPGGKQIGDPDTVHTKATVAGVHLDAAHAAHEPGQYTESEFIKHIGSLSWNQAGKLWQMQHYLPPQQQMQIAMMNHVGAQRSKAEQLYNQLKGAAGASPTALAKAKKDFEDADKLYWDTSGRFTSPQTYALPSMGNFGGGTE